MKSIFKRYSQYKEIILLDDYTFAGGGGRPIYSYYRNIVSKGRRDTLFLRLAVRGSLLKLLVILFFRNRVIINGVSAFKYWPVHFLCFFKKDVMIYLHEGEPHIQPFEEKYKVKFRSFIYFLKRKHIGFVSEWQRDYFRMQYGIKHGAVIYNAITFPPVLPTAEGVTNIGMISFQTKNKNIDFYSKVADYAVELKLPYKFFWIGGEGGEMQELYHSKNVAWLGDQDQVMDILNSIDILFFPSFSDTFGLVIVEALYKGKRVVAYKENGMANYLYGLKGCRIFCDMDEQLVLSLFKEVIEENVDEVSMRELSLHLCGVENLEKRINSLFTS